MQDFLKRFALWAVRKAAYLVVAAAVYFTADYLKAAEGAMFGMSLKVYLASLGAVVASELRRSVGPKLLAVLMSGEVPKE